MKKEVVAIAIILLMTTCFSYATNATTGGDPPPNRPGIRPPIGMNSIPLDGSESTSRNV